MAQKKGNGGSAKKGGAGPALGLVGLAAAAAAGAYFLYGSKEGAKRRAKIRGWSLKAKGEVLDRLEGLKEVNQEAYDKVVDTVTDKYKKMKNVDVAELALLTQDLKRHWGNIRRQMNSGGGSRSSGAKKPAAKKRTAKKSGTQSESK